MKTWNKQQMNQDPLTENWERYQGTLEDLAEQIAAEPDILPTPEELK